MSSTVSCHRHPAKFTGWSASVLATCIFFLVPVWWILSEALKDPTTLSAGSFWPTKWSWSNFAAIFNPSAGASGGASFLYALRNSVCVSLISTGVAVILAMMAAYAMSRLAFPGKSILLGTALVVLVFPQISLATPFYKLWSVIHIFNTWWGLAIPYITLTLPLAIFILSAFFRDIPWDLEQAAAIDGATPFQSFRLVIAPLVTPAIVTTAIIIFIFCWNDFLFSLTLTTDQTGGAITVPALMSYLAGQNQFVPPYGKLMAVAFVMTIPVVIFVLIFQRRIVAGLTSGAVKG
jgi:multiple sugar transport system permease protein